MFVLNIRKTLMKNQQAKTLILDTNKNIRQIENETNEKKKLHLKKIAEIEMIKRKNEIEKAYSLEKYGFYVAP